MRIARDCRNDAAFGRRLAVAGLLPAVALLLAGCGGDFAATLPGIDPSRAAVARIGAVQGGAERSPHVGATVTVPGVVTGSFVNGLGGFFMQDERGAEDGDPRTSDAIFVRWPGDAAPKVRRGDRVRVVGTVAELGDGGQTQTALVDAAIEVLGRAAVEATAISAAPSDEAGWEALEGMWLRFAVPLTVAGNYGLGRHGQLEVSLDDRPSAIGVEMAPSDPAAAERAARTRTRMLVLDDARHSENPERLWFLPDPPDPAQPLRAGSTLRGVEGVLDHGGFGRRLQLTAKLAQIEQAARPAAPQPGVEGVRLGHFNVLNFFNGDGNDGGFPTARGASTPAELERQQAKLVAMILALAPDVASVVELENDGDGPDSAQQQLVDALNAALGDAGDYRGVRLPSAAAGDDAIRVGLIYRDSRVRPVGRSVQLSQGPFADRARPPLAQAFEPVAGGPAFTVASVHLKSKGGCQDVPDSRPADRDQGDGVSCWNALRSESAQALHDWLQGDPTASGTDLAVMLGDFNANTFEQPMMLLREQGWRDAIPVGDRDGYTYNYRGQANRLDHAMLSPPLAAALRFATTWHINADESPLFDYSLDGSPLQQYRPDPYRASDHDPLLLVLQLPTSR